MNRVNSSATSSALMPECEVGSFSSAILSS
jgi:hypothetical protein